MAENEMINHWLDKVNNHCLMKKRVRYLLFCQFAKFAI